MRCHDRGIVYRSILIGITLFETGWAATACAQDVPSPEAFGGAPSAPSTSPPSPASTTTAVALPLSHEAQLEARVRQLESLVNQLSRRLPQTSPGSPAPAPGGAGGEGPGGNSEVGSGTADPDKPAPGNAPSPSAAGGVGGPGQSLPPNPAPSARFDIPATLERKKSNVIFGPGFEIRSDDDEYILQFHNLTQFEYRGYQQYGQQSVKDSFLLPRQWFMWSGRITKPIGYFLSISEGFDTINILDVFLDFEYDPRFRIRMGRFKTPFTYEFFVEPVQGLLLPERSIFFNNFGQNRDLGIMPYGRLFRNTTDYAVGIFNGNRNGYVAQVDSKFISAFVNFKPFVNSEGSPLENFNIGGSVFGGNTNQVPVPQTLRTVVPITGNSVAGVPFLGFNNNVRQNGMLTFWDLHMAYFYRQFALIGEWASGFQDYAPSTQLANKTHLPINSFYLGGSYMLTGETRSQIGIVKPRHPFNPARQNFGMGAWELIARYQLLDIDSEVFTRGLADGNLWANRVETVDVGINWHMTQYLKFMFEWEHAMFNNPIIYAPGKFQSTSDLFVARFQLYF